MSSDFTHQDIFTDYNRDVLLLSISSAETTDTYSVCVIQLVLYFSSNVYVHLLSLKKKDE